MSAKPAYTAPLAAQRFHAPWGNVDLTATTTAVMDEAVMRLKTHEELVTALRQTCDAFNTLHYMATKQTKHNFALEMAERGMTMHDQQARAVLDKVSP